MNLVKVAILDVGQGDTIVVHSEGPDREAIIIDCVNAQKVRNYLISNNISRIRALIVTHLHSDHYSQAKILLENAPNWFPGSPASLLFRGLPEGRYSNTIFHSNPNEHSLYRALLTWALANNNRLLGCAPRPHPLVNTQWEEIIDLLQPNEAEYAALLGGDFNDTSLIIRVKGKG